MKSELELRKEAIRLYYQGVPKVQICRQLDHPRAWLDRWLQRYNPDDVEASLSDHKRGPQQPSTRWSAAVREQVIQMRQARMQHEQSPYDLIGAEAIHYELQALGNPEVPPPVTIHRWLKAANLIPPRHPAADQHESKPIPIPQATAVNRVQQLDLKGPIYLRGSSQKYYLVVLRDRYSHRCAVDALRSRQAQEIVLFLVKTWQWLGLPHYLQLDNALEFRGSNRYPRSFGRLIRVAADLGVEVVFNPANEPWRNGGIERYNGFLGERLLRTEFANFAALRREAARCQQRCNSSHRLPAFDGATPDELAAQVPLHLLAADYHRHTTPSLPQDQGFVSFVRLVRKSGRITLGTGDRFMVDPKRAHSYVLARVDLAKHKVKILQEGKVLKTYDYSAATVGAWAGEDQEEPAEEADL